MCRIGLLGVIALLAVQAQGQRTFTFKALSDKYDVQLRPEKLDLGVWRGKTEVTIFRKGSNRPFQTIHLDDTCVSLDESGRPDEAEIRDKRNGKWSTVYLDDLNFDGLEDLAVADGTNGGYRGISYRVYVFGRSAKRFVYSKEFTRLAQGPYFGIPEVNLKTKTLEVFWKSGAGFHEIQRYKIIRNRPVKIYERSEGCKGDGYCYITTRRLVQGKWRTWDKIVKASETNQL